MRLNIVTIGLVLAERIERSRTTICDVCRAWRHLLRRFVPNRKTTIIIGYVFISIVATLSETLLKTVTFVD